MSYGDLYLEGLQYTGNQYATFLSTTDASYLDAFIGSTLYKHTHLVVYQFDASKLLIVVDRNVAY